MAFVTAHLRDIYIYIYLGGGHTGPASSNEGLFQPTLLKVSSSSSPSKGIRPKHQMGDLKITKELI